ncbi:hypothetical protein GO755_38530 [Spirosoma sp. HMF4905]|uniref:Uncharacterized protein n=1 Tax=Spirosoma arboris TaxID=2682092 RepID=A0A7K1SQ89_9BACT|nr:hypothetical protein [Spirosoma arboris]MVM35974.1 hypothetical protein [Spirosoma arboris]
MFTKRPLPFSDFLNSLQTFDILLMHGLHASSLAVETVEGANWSHSAIVVVAGDLNLPGIHPETRLLWESNTQDPIDDVILNVSKQGPQLTRLYDRIVYNTSVKYDSDVAARKLYLPQPITQHQIAILEAVIKETHSANFPQEGGPGMEEMMNFIIGRFKNLPVTDNTFFCSQLVAHTYKALGLLTQAYVDNSYAPLDFSEKLDVSLLTGWLGREIMLDTKTIPLWNPNAHDSASGS